MSCFLLSTDLFNCDLAYWVVLFTFSACFYFLIVCLFVFSFFGSRARGISVPPARLCCDTAKSVSPDSVSAREMKDGLRWAKGIRCCPVECFTLLVKKWRQGETEVVVFRLLPGSYYYWVDVALGLPFSVVFDSPPSYFCFLFTLLLLSAGVKRVDPSLLSLAQAFILFFHATLLRSGRLFLLRIAGNFSTPSLLVRIVECTKGEEVLLPSILFASTFHPTSHRSCSYGATRYNLDRGEYCKGEQRRKANTRKEKKYYIVLVIYRYINDCTKL